MNLNDILQQYLGGGAGQARSDVHDHFDAVAESTSPDHIATGLSEAFRSDQTPPFPQMLSQLFGNSNGGQRATILNQLISAIGPMAASQLPALAGLLRGGSHQVTPAEAERVPPEAVQQAAEHAQQANPSIVDTVSQTYARHPQLIKTLGAAALTIAMAKIAQRQFPGR